VISVKDRARARVECRLSKAAFALPGGHTGQSLPVPPAGAFTVWVYGYIWLSLKFCSDFTTKHMRPPRPFVLKWRYAEVPWLENRRYVQALTSENLAQA